MLDHDFGVLLDKLDELGIAGDTIVVFAGDNGAEDHLIGRGTAGFFDGSYFSSAEGGIRTPCLVRWPGRIRPGGESNEMVHVTDMFTTLLHNIVREFNDSVEREQLIPTGSPLDFVPATGGAA